MSEKEYIEKEALVQHIDRTFGEISTPFVIREIRKFPKADVVEADRGVKADSDFQWISVEERLPDKDGRYLCWYTFDSDYSICLILSYEKNSGQNCEVDYRGVKRNGWYWFDNNIEEKRVTHWMSLPEAPEK